jgi:glycosyltransferase involved in cell wall biosynthesis
MPQELPKVSVIMPVFNCAAYLEDAVRSVLHQTEPDLELIVVDDGSTDDSPTILQRLANQDPRMRISRQARSQKPGIARNAGRHHARGEFITFLDGDDLYHREKLRRELQVFDRYPETDLVFADLQKFTARPDEADGEGWLRSDQFVKRAEHFMVAGTQQVYLCGPHFYRFMSSEITAVNMQTVMVRRAVLQAEPYWFNEEFLVGEDADLFFRLARRCRLVFIDEVLAYYRQRPDSVTSDRPRRLQSELRVYADNLARARPVLTGRELFRCRQQVAVRYHDLGECHYAQAQMTPARNAYRQAMLLTPRLGTLIGWMKTWAPASVIGWARRLRQSWPRPERTA